MYLPDSPPISFPAFDAITARLPATERADLFAVLPEHWQARAWRRLADLEAANRAMDGELPIGNIAPPKPRRTGTALPPTDDLLTIPPPIYVERLTGEQVPRHGVVHCPLPGHDERTPSFKVYEEPDRGVYCFGCHRGGGIYDFAAALWGRGTRGDDFKRLRTDLSDVLLGRAA